MPEDFIFESFMLVHCLTAINFRLRYCNWLHIIFGVSPTYYGCSPVTSAAMGGVFIYLFSFAKYDNFYTHTNIKIYTVKTNWSKTH
jgi:hypothetical protein